MMTKIKQPANTVSISAKHKMAHTINNTVLSAEINAEIACNIIATTPAPETAMRIKNKLMQRVQVNAHQFVFAHQGEWKQVFVGVHIKLLHQDGERKSFLLKMAENTHIPSHLHAQDEESYVLEGSVELEGILCHAGDYHFAQAGSQHQMIKSVQGCTLLINSL